MTGSSCATLSTCGSKQSSPASDWPTRGADQRAARPRGTHPRSCRLVPAILGLPLLLSEPPPTDAGLRRADGGAALPRLKASCARSATNGRSTVSRRELLRRSAAANVCLAISIAQTRQSAPGQFWSFWRGRRKVRTGRTGQRQFIRERRRQIGDRVDGGRSRVLFCQRAFASSRRCELGNSSTRPAGTA